MRCRKSAVAGMFYPSDQKELLVFIKNAVENAKNLNLNPRILIAPHAGYIYSGQTAGHAYAQLKESIKTILLIGPSHRVAFEGISFSPDDAFSTPLGEIKVNTQKTATFFSAVKNNSYFFFHETPHAQEHSLEVHLPFLKFVLPECDIIPIVYGKVEYEKLLFVLDFFLQDKDTVAIISSDLSHYHPYGTAKRIDAHCTEAIETLDLHKMHECEACGETGIKAGIAYSKEHNLRSITLDYKTSGDTAGDKQSVVGYGSYMFFEE